MLLFTATMSDKLLDFAKQYMRPSFAKVLIGDLSSVSPDVEQRIVLVSSLKFTKDLELVVRTCRSDFVYFLCFERKQNCLNGHKIDLLSSYLPCKH